MVKQHSVNITLEGKSEEEKIVIKDAILWLLTYQHLEVFRKKEFIKGASYTEEYPLAIHFEGDLENLVLTNVENLYDAQAKEICEVAEKHGILGVVAWFAYRVGDNDVIHEMYKNDDYNGARKMLGLGAESQMEEDYDSYDSETLEIIIISYSDCLCDLVKFGNDYQEWMHVTSDLEEE